MSLHWGCGPIHHVMRSGLTYGANNIKWTHFYYSVATVRQYVLQTHAGDRWSMASRRFAVQSREKRSKSSLITSNITHSMYLLPVHLQN